MFNNNHIVIHEVRYANPQQDSLIVLFSDQREEKPQVQEMEVEVRKGDAYYEAVRKKGWTKKKIVDATALYKLNSVRAIDKIVNAKLDIRMQRLDEREEQLKRMFEQSDAQWKKLDKHKQQLTLDLETQTKKKYDEIDNETKKRYDQVDEYRQNKETELEGKRFELETRYKDVNHQWEKLKKQESGVKAKQKIIQEAAQKQKEKQVKLNQAESIMEQEITQKFERSYQTKIQEMIVDTFERNQDPDDIFKFKLALFEVDTIAKAPREFKLRLRKAKSIVQCYAIVNDLYEFLQNESTQ